MPFSNYQVDNIPTTLKPLFYLYGYGLGLIFYIGLSLLNITIRVKIKGGENIEEHANYIFCHWHTYITLYAGAVHGLKAFGFYKPKHAWLQHAAGYMKPIHVLLNLLGVPRIILGSTGHGGKRGADRLADCLRQGHSTVLLPDGPSGPPFVLRKGVLHLALQSGVPIVPMRWRCSKYHVCKGWDQKRFPHPFSIITVQFMKPIRVGEDNFSQAGDELIQALGQGEETRPQGPNSGL